VRGREAWRREAWRREARWWERRERRRGTSESDGWEGEEVVTEKELREGKKGEITVDG